VLLAVMRVGSDAYGMTVRKEIGSATGRYISIGAVYATLNRLESKGFIKSHTGEPTAERGGRAKRHFRMTADGKGGLRTTHEIILKMSAAGRASGSACSSPTRFCVRTVARSLCGHPIETGPRSVPSFLAELPSAGAQWSLHALSLIDARLYRGGTHRPRSML